jgi:hypothetical protein
VGEKVEQVPDAQVLTVVDDALEAKTYRLLGPAEGIETVNVQDESTAKFSVTPEEPEVGETEQPLTV